MSPITIKLQPFGRCEPANGKRVWDVAVTIGGTGGLLGSGPSTKRLEDYFTKQEYEAYEKFVVDLEGELKRKEQAHGPPSVLPGPIEGPVSTRSENPQDSWPPSFVSQSTGLTAESDRSGAEYSSNSSLSHFSVSGNLERELCKYREYLAEWLELNHQWADEKEIKIYICETLNPADLDDPDYPSFHSLLWECLESRSPPVEQVRNRKGREPQQIIHITRVIIHNASPTHLPAGLRCRDKTIKLLVVVARHFGKRHHKYWSQSMFDDPPSVVQDTLIDLVQYLRAVGRSHRLQVSVLRPGTLDELDSHLTNHSYDMVHLDLHGDVRDGPILCFAKSFSKDQKHRVGRSTDRLAHHFAPVGASEVAKILEKHNITVVVLSACLSSWAHSRPLSNMCHVFANHGVKAVTGMSYSVLYDAAHAYFDVFYRYLVLENMDFRTSSLKARETLQPRTTRDNAMSQCWPIVTTYYTTRKLDRAETGVLGIGMAPHNHGTIDKVKSFETNGQLGGWIICLVVGLTMFKCLLAPDLSSTHPVVIAAGVTFGLQLISRHVVIHYPTTDKQKDRFPSVKKFEEFQDCSKKLRPPMRHSVGLMALEDRLKAKGKLLLVVEPTLCGHGKKRRIQYIRDLWSTTEFANDVQDFDAGAFSRASYRAWRDMSAWREKKVSNDARSGVLIFYNMEKVLRDSSALEAINLLITQREMTWSRGCYLLMISSKPWTGENLQPAKRKWVLAESFNAIEHFNIFFPYETDNDPP